MSSSESFLVELAALLVRLRKLFLGAFVFVLIAGASFQLLSKPKYQYVTLVKLAENGEGDLIETSEGVITSIESQWLPRVWREFRGNRDQVPSFEVDAREVEGGYIILTSVGASDNASEIDKVHSALVNSVVERQAELVRLVKDKLKAQIEVAEKSLKTVSRGEGSESSVSGVLETLVSLEGRLAGMQNAEIRVVAQQKEKSLGLDLPVRLALVFLMSVIVGVLAVLSFQFANQVREKVRGDTGQL